MKNQLRDLTLFLALFVLLLAGCGENPKQSAAPDVTIGDDPVAQILKIIEIPDRFERTEKLIAILRALPAEQSSEVIPVVLNQLTAPLREVERVYLVSGWAKTAPADATHWAMTAEHHELLRSMMFDESAYLWALNDPKSVRTDLKVSLYSMRGWDPTMLRAFIRGWFDSGEPKVEKFIRDMSRTGDDRQRAISELIRTKLEHETPDELIEWVTNLRGGAGFRSYAYSRVAADIAAIDPARAVAWCEEICGTEVGEDLPHWIASSWVRKGGAEAMDWIVAQPNTLSARIGIRSSFRRFLKAFPEQSDAWVEKFSEEERASEMLQGPVIMYVNRQSNLARWEVALAWSVYIDNDWERERSLQTVARRWLRRDESAAEVWLTETMELADVTKKELRAENDKYKKKVEKNRAERAARPAWVTEALAD